MPLDISVEDSVFTPVVPAHDDVELLSGLRMERVSDFDGTGHLAGAGCSWLDERKSAGEGRPSRDEGASSSVSVSGRKPAEGVGQERGAMRGGLR